MVRKKHYGIAPKRGETVLVTLAPNRTAMCLDTRQVMEAGEVARIYRWRLDDHPDMGVEVPEEAEVAGWPELPAGGPGAASPPVPEPIGTEPAVEAPPAVAPPPPAVEPPVMVAPPPIVEPSHRGKAGGRK